MTWWVALLVVAIPAGISGAIGWLTWRNLCRGQVSRSEMETTQADQIKVGTVAALRGQVDTLWRERNSAQEDLRAARAELAAARIELANARADLAAARGELAYTAGETARLRTELNRARERISILEREVIRLGGSPAALNGKSPA